MTAKITKGSSFSGAVDYDMDKDGELKKDAALIYVSPRLGMGGDLSNPDPHKISMAFEIQASLNPSVKRPVYHVVISFHPADDAKLSDQAMVRIAIQYLVMMGLTDTQFTVTRHREKDNPHMHIIINMVNNEGKRLSDFRDYQRSEEVCKDISLQNGFRWGLHKTLSRVSEFRDPREEVRYGIAKALLRALNDERVRDMEDLALALSADGIDTTIKIGENQKPIGVKFSKRGKDRKKKSKTYVFSGRQIDRCFSYARIMNYMTNALDFGALRKKAIDLDDKFQDGKDELPLDDALLQDCNKLHRMIQEIRSSEQCMSEDPGVDDRTARRILRLMYLTPLHEIVRRVEPLLLVAVAIKDIDKPKVQESKTPENEYINKHKKH